MAKRKSRPDVVQAREDRRAFLAYLTGLLAFRTGLLAFLASVVNIVTAALNFFTARQEQAALRHYVLKAETGHFRVITGTANVQLGLLTASGTGTVTNPPA